MPAPIWAKEAKHIKFLKSIDGFLAPSSNGVCD